MESCTPAPHVVTHHVSLLTGDDLLHKFLEVEEGPMSDSSLSMEERTVICHFQTKYYQKDDGRFIVFSQKV